MKYMGSKRFMLTNGFGDAILAQASHAGRIVDLFAGSAAVTWFAAERTNLPVHAYDLQQYSVVLARAILGRTSRIDPQALRDGWLRPARRAVRRSRLFNLWAADYDRLDARAVHEARRLCAEEPGRGPLWPSYGGHYFSPHQAVALDVALAYLPDNEPQRSLCHAAIVVCASYCAAAPGHTAQPFQPTSTSLPYIADIWRRDPFEKIDVWLCETARRHAIRRGSARVGDALRVAQRVTSDDLVIVDPPYSAVQYSRFYHVLETVALERQSAVTGVGRYPPKAERPSSVFSLRSESETAITALLDALAAAGCRVLVTFPAGDTSNGLSGARLTKIARERFDVSSKTVLGRFSTMGGNNSVRASRQASAELILSLVPR